MFHRTFPSENHPAAIAKADRTLEGAEWHTLAGYATNSKQCNGTIDARLLNKPPPAVIVCAKLRKILALPISAHAPST